MLDALGKVERPSLADDLGARGGGGDDDEAYASGATPPVERLRHNNRRVTISEIAVVKVRGGVSADSEQIADVFTKATSRVVHEALVPKVMGLSRHSDCRNR